VFLAGVVLISVISVAIASWKVFTMLQDGLANWFLIVFLKRVCVLYLSTFLLWTWVMLP
jgi:hypothetical protein